MKYSNNGLKHNEGAIIITKEATPSLKWLLSLYDATKFLFPYGRINTTVLVVKQE